VAKDVRFKWNKPIPQIIDDVGINAKTAKYAAQDWHRLYSPFVPYREGPLSKVVIVRALPNKAVIRHLMIYAANMYYNPGYRFGKRPHPLATAYWDKAAVAAGKKEVLIRNVQAYVKKKG